MEFTDVIQQGYALNVGDGNVEYRLETSVMSAGELPTTHIFVYEISLDTEPGSDVFKRVASVADLTDLKIDRDAAVTAADTEYLSNYNEVQYADLDVAKQAKTMVGSRINELIRTWISFRDDFEVDTDLVQYYPTSTSTEEEALKDAYGDAKAARIEKEGEVSDKDTEITTAKASCDKATEIIQIYEAEKQFYDDVLNVQFPEYADLVDVEGTTAATYKNGTLIPSFVDFNSNASASYVSWVNTKQTCDQTVATLTTDKAELDAELEAAQAAEDEALAAVLAVCPDFDPASV